MAVFLIVYNCAVLTVAKVVAEYLVKKLQLLSLTYYVGVIVGSAACVQLCQSGLIDLYLMIIIFAVRCRNIGQKTAESYSASSPVGLV